MSTTEKAPYRPPRGPRFRHDCSVCTFIQRGVVSGSPVDWYRCRDSIIARHSSEPADYWSTLITCLPSLAAVGSSHAAAALAILKGA